MALHYQQLVMAYFDQFEAAESAAKSLMAWDKASPDIRLGALGVLRQTEDGKVKTKKYGYHNTGKGATIGLLLGILAAVLPGIGLVAGALVGAVAGGVFGGMSKESLGLKDEDLANLKGALSDGKAVLIVLSEPEEANSVQAELEKLGGKVERYVTSPEDLAKIAEEAKAPPPDETEAAPSAPAED
ncbi:MAG: hypothetical protein H6Q37_200 [Chloroflexi bacterium]|nr:hypothetical protein [Chloroflexota bacterium]